MRFRSFLVHAGFAPFLIAAAQPVRLQPSSPWDVDYAENSCRLIRIFGTGKAETKLVFESTAPGEMDMLVFGKPLDTSLDEVSAKFLPVESETFVGRTAQTVTEKIPAILWSGVPMSPPDTIDRIGQQRNDRRHNPTSRPPAVPLSEQAEYRAQRQQFAASVTELELQTRKNRPIILETGSMGDALAAFDKCGRDSLKDWGVDPDLEDKIVRPVWLANAGSLIGSEDYPKQMLWAGEQSEVKVRVLVDASGHVTKCTPLSHFELPEFNQLVCDRMTRRGRFEPAELADGTKVASYYINHVVFRIAW